MEKREISDLVDEMKDEPLRVQKVSALKGVAMSNIYKWIPKAESNRQMAGDVESSLVVCSKIKRLIARKRFNSHANHKNSVIEQCAQ